MRDSKERIPIKITKICIASYFMPIILFILIDSCGNDNEIFSVVSLILFLILLAHFFGI